MSSKSFQACYGCENRYVGCHSSCKKYIENRAKLDARNTKEKQLKVSENINKWDFDKIVRWAIK